MPAQKALTNSADPDQTASENLSLVFANNKGVNQPVHPHSLISAFVIRFGKYHYHI